MLEVIKRCLTCVLAVDVIKRTRMNKIIKKNKEDKCKNKKSEVVPYIKKHSLKPTNILLKSKFLILKNHIKHKI